MDIEKQECVIRRRSYVGEFASILKNVRGIHFRLPLSRELKTISPLEIYFRGYGCIINFHFPRIYIRFHLVDFVDTCSKFYTLESEGEYQKCMGWLRQIREMFRHIS